MYLNMDKVIILSLIFISLINNISGVCVNVPNDDMIEYFCQDGNPYDLYAIPDRTEKIRISNMNVERITNDMFARFGDNLWVLTCSHCRIVDIEPDSFKRLKNLQQLRLDNNHLTTIKSSWFNDLKYLTYLDFNYNRITKIEDGVFVNLPSLVDLRVSGNELECINVDELSRLSDLHRIFINRNPKFKCPNAVSRLLENKNIDFEKDPEWTRITEDLIRPESSTTTPMYRERLIITRPSEIPVTSTNNPTSVYHQNYDTISTGASWPMPSSVTNSYQRPIPTSETNYPSEYWSNENEDTSLSPHPSSIYNEPYYPPQVPKERSSTLNPYWESFNTNDPTVLPTSTSKISWSGDVSESIDEKEYIPIELLTSPAPTGPPLHEDSGEDENENEEKKIEKIIKDKDELIKDLTAITNMINGLQDLMNGETTTMMSVPSTPDIDDEFYPKSYPLENYQQVDEGKPIVTSITPTTLITSTTDKPFPKCKSSSSSLTISLEIIIISIFYSIIRTF